MHARQGLFADVDDAVHVEEDGACGAQGGGSVGHGWPVIVDSPSLSSLAFGAALGVPRRMDSPQR